MKKNLLNGFALAAAALCGVPAAFADAPAPLLSEDFPFTVTTLPEGWLQIDANNDGFVWTPKYGDVEISDFSVKLDLDDWLFTKGVQLEAGKTYQFEYKPAHGYQGNNPKLTVLYGKEQTVEGMTEVIAPETEIELYFAQGSTKIQVIPSESGLYYFGFHATGEQTSGIKLDDVILREATMPAVVEDLLVEKVGEYGSPDVKVSFKAPTKTVGGDDLDGIEKISVTRSGISVKEITDATPGQQIEFDDVCAYGSGNYVWKVVVTGTDGQQSAEAEFGPLFVGVNTPAKAENVKIVEDGHTGMMTLTWDPVTKDVAGEDIPADKLDYQVSFNGSYIVETGATSPYEFKACEPDEQVFGLASVIVKTSYGSSVAPTEQFIAGKMLTGLKESFDGGRMTNNFRISGNPDDTSKTSTWYVFDNEMEYMYTGLTAGDADNTGGCAAFMGMYSGCKGSADLGKFDLTGFESPAISFQVYYTGTTEETKDKNVYTIFADKGEGMEVVKAYDMAETPFGAGWRKVIVPLDAVKGDEVVLRLTAEVVNNSWMLLDDIRIFNLCNKNLSVVAPVLPEEIKAGSEFIVDTKVENIGKEDFGEYTVKLYEGEKLVGEMPFEGLEAGKFMPVHFHHNLTLLHGDTQDMRLEVVCEDDDDSDNAVEFTVNNKLPNYPAVTDLAAVSVAPRKVALAWSEPDLDVSIAEPVLESFESGVSGAIDSFGEWSFVDGDGGNTMVVDEYDPIEGQGSPFAGLIVDTTGHMSPVQANSGTKMMVMQPSENNDTDDWLISPELTGDAQTVTFFARSYDQYGYFGESFDFAFSSTGKEPADFTESYPSGKVPGAWQQYNAELPEGTKYFAIHYHPSMAIMLMLDDFTFTPAYAATPLQLAGYNIYRDGAKLNEEPFEELEYNDDAVAEGDHVYHVTVIYDRGESRGSNAAEVKVSSGVADVEAAGVTVAAGEGCIMLGASDAALFTVMAADGAVVARKNVTGNTAVQVPSGIYIVSVKDTAHKVLVK